MLEIFKEINALTGQLIEDLDQLKRPELNKVKEEIEFIEDELRAAHNSSTAINQKMINRYNYLKTL